MGPARIKLHGASAAMTPNRWLEIPQTSRCPLDGDSLIDGTRHFPRADSISNGAPIPRYARDEPPGWQWHPPPRQCHPAENGMLLLALCFGSFPRGSMRLSRPHHPMTARATSSIAESGQTSQTSPKPLSEKLAVISLSLLIRMGISASDPRSMPSKASPHQQKDHRLLSAQQ